MVYIQATKEFLEEINQKNIKSKSSLRSQLKLTLLKTNDYNRCQIYEQTFMIICSDTIILTKKTQPEPENKH